MWREMMLDAVLSEQGVKISLDLFQNNPKIGMIGSAHITTDDYTTYSKIEAKAINEMHKLCLSVPEDKTFVAGTMFWVRAKLLKPFLIYKLEDFSVSNDKIHDFTLAHIIERVLGWSISAQGYKIEKIEIESFKRRKNRIFLYFCIMKIAEFFYKKKITKKGYLLIKIFKIPVIHRKVKK
jgi:lipopolysaccharide biosynthesis protein